MSDSNEDGVCGDGAPDFIPPRAHRSGRRSGVMPLVERDESAILESVKAAPRRSSIIKVTTQVLGFCTWNTPVSCQVNNLTRPCLLDIKLKSDHCGIVANL